jgi:hypothetical protein
MSYFIEKEQKSPFKHIRFGRSKSPVKGLSKFLLLTYQFCYQAWDQKGNWIEWHWGGYIVNVLWFSRLLSASSGNHFPNFWLVSIQNAKYSGANTRTFIKSQNILFLAWLDLNQNSFTPGYLKYVCPFQFHRSTLEQIFPRINFLEGLKNPKKKSLPDYGIW